MKKYFLQLKFFIVLLMVNFLHVTRSFFICDAQKMTNNNEKLYQYCLEAENLLGSFFQNHSIYEKYSNSYENLKNTYGFSPGDNLSILRNSHYIKKIYFNPDTKKTENLFIADMSFLEIITMYRVYHEIYCFIKNTSVYDFVVFFDHGYKFLNNSIKLSDSINILDNSYISYTLCLFYHRFFSTIWTPEERKNKKKFLLKVLKIKNDLQKNWTFLSSLETNISLWEDVLQTMEENQCSMEEKQSFFTLGHILTSINSSLDDA